ncbi:MAG: hypothetical protein ACRC10_11630 [Thermoguttaceae bacterium]
MVVSVDWIILVDLTDRADGTDLAEDAFFDNFFWGSVAVFTIVVLKRGSIGTVLFHWVSTTQHDFTCFQVKHNGFDARKGEGRGGGGGGEFCKGDSFDTVKSCNHVFGEKLRKIH